MKEQYLVVNEWLRVELPGTTEPSPWMSALRFDPEKHSTEEAKAAFVKWFHQQLDDGTFIRLVPGSQREG